MPPYAQELQKLNNKKEQSESIVLKQLFKKNSNSNFEKSIMKN